MPDKIQIDMIEEQIAVFFVLRIRKKILNSYLGIFQFFS